MESKKQEDIAQLKKEYLAETYEYYARSLFMRFVFRGEDYCLYDDGPGLSVRKSFDNTGDPIFTMPLGTPWDVFLDSVMLDGKSLKWRLDHFDEEIKDLEVA